LWNLIPGDPSVNSSKSNQLPDLNRYLTRFSHTQQAALQVFLEAKQESRLLEDYLQLQLPPTDLIQLPEAEFRLRYEQLLAPLIQIATNTGFTPNWYHHADLPLS
jgi:predicted NACHT family NTPase